MTLRNFGKRLQYFINDLLIRNPLWQILFLIAVSFLVILAGASLIKGHATDDSTETSFWWSFTRLLDQGTFIEDHYDKHIAVVGVLVTLSGIMILSLLIGVLSSKINERLDSLKRGRSPIVEKGHFIVCGNGDRLYEVTRELIEARRDEGLFSRKSLVMFSASSREEMEEVLAQRTGRKSVSEVICRSGEVTDIDSLRLVGFDRCSGFVIIGDDDHSVMKTLIAVSSLCEENDPVAVCEIRNRTMGSVAEMAHKSVHWVPVREVVMRLVVQVCRQPGLSAVYKELLSFEGNEFYLRDCPRAQGLSLGEIGLRQSHGVVCGIQKEGKVYLNPPLETVFEQNDRLLILSKNSGKFHLKAEPRDEGRKIAGEKEPCGKLFKMLIFSGQSTKFTLMLRLLDEYSLNGAEIMVAGSLPEEEGRKYTSRLECHNCTVNYTRMNRTEPEEVIALNPEYYDSIMVVSGKEPGKTDEKADSECIVTLLILKSIREREGTGWNGTVVAEIRNPRNRRLASAAEIDDFVISNEVCSMMMAQLVKQKELGQVFEEIFDPSGCEIQLRCASGYSHGPFHELEMQGRSRREVVLGWLIGTGSDAVVTLNPPRDEEMPENRDCRVIAIAER